MQLSTHCSYNKSTVSTGKRIKMGSGTVMVWKRGTRTSFDESALLVKSLQHELKQRSTRFEYMRMKSCI